MNNAINKLLIAFGGEALDYWKNNRSSKIDYPQDHLLKRIY